MIETIGLTKRFDDFLAVDDVTLSVQPGQVLGLLGPNGAGKTTTVRMLTAILRPSAGTARVAGFDVVDDAAMVRRQIGVLTEHHGLYLRMNGREYIDFFGEIYGLDPALSRKRGEELAERFGLLEAYDRRVGGYSKGMRQKLALVRALIHNPPVLLLDEPTSAMDPLSARLVRDAIHDLRGDGRAIILTTHNLPEAEELADTIAIIRRGRIIAQGRETDLKLRMLGPTLYELTLAGPVNGLARELNGIVEVVSSADRSLRYRSANPAETNPALIRRLAGLGVDVLALAEVPQSLEEVYLRVVAEDEAGSQS